MGLTPHDINEMSLWEYMACADGWKQAHQSEEKAPAMSDDVAAELGIEGF
jgi:hypothetical protein